jgi:hypothetical protein
MRPPVPHPLWVFISVNKKHLALRLVIGFVYHNALGAQQPVALGSAANFAVLAGTTVTSAGATVVYGDVGVSPGTTVTGAPTVIGSFHYGDPTASHAQNDLTTAYNDAAGRTVGSLPVAGDIGNQTFAPGLYTSTSSLEISSANVILDAAGNTNAVWIFQMASTLTTDPYREVILTNGAQAINVFWQVGSSATIGTSSVFKGNILALASISLNQGASLEGRALASTGAVTLSDDSVTNDMPVPPSFGPTTVAANGAVTLMITNTANVTLTLQISSDLVHWTFLTLLTPTVSPYVFTDNTASGELQRFYRIEVGSNSP